MKVKRKAKPLLLVIIFLVIVIMVGVGTWKFLTGPVDKKNTEDIEVVIKSGTNTSGIAKLLKDNGLIHNEKFFKVYVKIHNVKSLKAATYKLIKGMSLAEIVDELENGSNYNPDMVKLTFKEGLRITDYAKVIDTNTNNSYDDVLAIVNDETYIKELINEYWFLTDAVLDERIYYPLEGYLAPDTYHFDNRDVDVKTIIETMLDEMDKKLSKYKSVISSDIHYYLTMASIVELEGTNTENRKMIVGIFENRLASGMNLGSDVTTYYGLQKPMTSDLTTEEFASINAYNTRSTMMIGKMPVGPICSASESSIEASANPTDNDYLFFVADKHGKIYYTKTNKEHDQKVAEIKKNGDWIW